MKFSSSKFFNTIGEALEFYSMENYISSYKHLIGCEIYCSEKDAFFIFNKCMNILSYDKFYLDDETLGTYEEYMQLHYPEYEYIWKHQL